MILIFFDQLWNSEIEQKLINKRAWKWQWFGLIVEVDLDYPDGLHQLHSDFPFAPTTDKIDPYWLPRGTTCAAERPSFENKNHFHQN